MGRPTPLDAGLGAREVLSTPGAGEVVGVHRVAAYLRFRSGVMALTSGLAPSGPLHLRVAVLPALRVGDPARTDGEVLRGPGWSVALDVPTWTGALPAVVDGAYHTPPHVDLPALAARLGGRGPGLTPAGDDVLAGALLGTRAACGPSAEPALRAVAASVRTTDMAGAFLHWAARGQCIEPAHAWLTASGSSDRDRAEQRLRAVGASSGAALLEGLRLVAGQLSVTEIQSIRTVPGPGLDQRCGRSVG